MAVHLDVVVARLECIDVRGGVDAGSLTPDHATHVLAGRGINHGGELDALRIL